jgi:tripartite-type tricarboxylate transporter receptor subunit TctC
MTRAIVALLLSLTVSTNAMAQPASDAGDWPKRVIRLIVTAAAGSSGDTVCRIVAQQLSERLGQQIVFDNRPAAAGTVASEAIARSTPDGYTIGLMTTSTHAISTIFTANLPYDPVKDFSPIAIIGSAPYVLAVYPGLAAKNVSELIALAKAKPKQINNGVFGTTSLGYLAGVLFEQQTGVQFNHIAYRSSAQAVIDAVAGRIEIQFSSLAPAIPLIREGKLRALATTGAKRVASLPDVPTLAESGFPDFDVALWMGLTAPAGTPPAIIERLDREVSDILKQPDIQNKLLQVGMVAEPANPAAAAARIQRDITKWQALVAKAGIKR